MIKEKYNDCQTYISKYTAHHLNYLILIKDEGFEVHKTSEDKTVQSTSVVSLGIKDIIISIGIQLK